jgi:exopolyphosphatase/guanosine-5'-triphosphate,3'-diphosphate pyrophosphatase
MPRIGKGLLPGAHISDEKINDLKIILKEYKSIIKSYNVESTIVTATNALRIASNSAKIVSDVRKEFSFEINIISGEEEAKLAFLGATFGIITNKIFLVIDIGGGSTEIITGSGDKILYKNSFQIGSVSATENFLTDSPATPSQLEKLENHIQNVFSSLNALKFDDHYPIAIAGTPTTLSCIKQDLTKFEIDKIELSLLSLNEVKEISETLAKMSSQEIEKRWSNIMRGRADIILAGSIILSGILKLLNLEYVYTSTKGIRYGAIINYLLDKRTP